MSPFRKNKVSEIDILGCLYNSQTLASHSTTDDLGYAKVIPNGVIIYKELLFIPMVIGRPDPLYKLSMYIKSSIYDGYLILEISPNVSVVTEAYNNLNLLEFYKDITNEKYFQKCENNS